MRHLPVLLSCCLALAACGDTARLNLADSTGAVPRLPPPVRTLLPTVAIAPARGWQEGQAPLAAPGTRVQRFASGLDHPRWLYVLPNGDVLVAETNAPPRPADSAGLKSWAMKKVMQRAGAATPSANRITLLRDTDGDGEADVRTTVLESLHSPFGMALVGNALYVANTDALMRYPYTPGATRLAGPGTRVTDLPAGPRNHHWTKNLIAHPDGQRLYVTVGSNSNAAEHGLEEETGRAAIWEVEAATGRKRLFATGLRNPNGMAWQPDTGRLWTVVNERDELGSDLVPDYLTEVHDGAFYGWPFSYFGQHLDPRIAPQRPDLVARARVPDYALGTHVAPLGLAYSQRNALPTLFHDGAFIGEHGSWNRRPPSGYKVVFVPFRDGRPAGPPIDVLSGFTGPDGQAFGRPVGVAFDANGHLLVADDVGNTVWRVQGTGAR